MTTASDSAIKRSNTVRMTCSSWRGLEGEGPPSRHIWCAVRNNIIPRPIGIPTHRERFSRLLQVRGQQCLAGFETRPPLGEGESGGRVSLAIGRPRGGATHCSAALIVRPAIPAPRGKALPGLCRSFGGQRKRRGYAVECNRDLKRRGAGSHRACRRFHSFRHQPCGGQFDGGWLGGT